MFCYCSTPQLSQVYLGIDEQGRVMYTHHPPCHIPDLPELYQMLTGRDPSRPMEINPYSNKLDYPRVRESDPAEALIIKDIEATGTVKRHITMKMIQGEICACMGKRHSAKCADKKKFLLHQMLETARRQSAARHANNPSDCTCSRELAKDFYTTGEGMRRCMLCPAAEVPELRLPVYDDKTALPIPGQFEAVKLYNHTCSVGECDSCGWDSFWAKCGCDPNGEVKIKIGSSEVTEKLCACPVDAHTAQMSWNAWVRVPCDAPPVEADPEFLAPGASKKATTTLQWMPVLGTGAEFMVALKSASEEHAEHMHWVNWHRVHFKRTVDRFLRAVAALKAMGSPVPEELRGWIMAQTDFSAKIEIPAAAQATGEFATHCNMLTSVLTCCPRMQKVDELPEGSSFKANLKAEQVEQYLATTTAVIFGMSEAKHNTSYYASVMVVGLYAALTGEAPEGTKMEVVHDGIRLKNSCTDQAIPFGSGIVDYDADDPTHKPDPIIKGDGHDHAAFAGLVRRMSSIKKLEAEGVRDDGLLADTSVKMIEFR